MTTKYDLTQSVMALNGGINRAAGVLGTRDDINAFLRLAVDQGGPWTGRFAGSNKDKAQHVVVTGLLAAIKTSLIGGDWEIAWGPSIFMHNDPDPVLRAIGGNPGGDYGLDNAMCVFHSASQDLYVVAIAGTNFSSLYGWFMEDAGGLKKGMVSAYFDVDGDLDAQIQDTDEHKAQISYGTALGVQILCRGMHDHKLGLIDSFLETVPHTDKTRLVFTGHSLGAALSPALAYRLRTDLIKAGWAAENILVLATAGPTPGNSRFAEVWADAFPKTEVADISSGNQIRAFNLMYWNSNDLVPHCWSYLHDQDHHENGYWWKYNAILHHMQTKIGQINGSIGGADLAGMLAIMVTAQKMGKAKHMGRLPNQSFEGSFPAPYWNFDLTPPGWASYTPETPYSVGSWLVAFSLAHSAQYAQLAGLTGKEVPVPVAFHQ